MLHLFESENNMHNKENNNEGGNIAGKCSPRRNKYSNVNIRHISKAEAPVGLERHRGEFYFQHGKQGSIKATCLRTR